MRVTEKVRAAVNELESLFMDSSRISDIEAIVDKIWCAVEKNNSWMDLPVFTNNEALCLNNGCFPNRHMDRGIFLKSMDAYDVHHGKNQFLVEFTTHLYTIFGRAYLNKNYRQSTHYAYQAITDLGKIVGRNASNLEFDFSFLKEKHSQDTLYSNCYLDFFTGGAKAMNIPHLRAIIHANDVSEIVNGSVGRGYLIEPRYPKKLSIDYIQIEKTSVPPIREQAFIDDIAAQLSEKSHLWSGNLKHLHEEVHFDDGSYGPLISSVSSSKSKYRFELLLINTDKYLK